jgi:hypothetical protein
MKSGAGLHILAPLAGVLCFLGSLRSALADDLQWEERQPEHRPTKRYEPAMAYDSDRKRTVLVGGALTDPDASIPDRSETWEWDGTDWLKRTLANHPPDFGNGPACYDSDRKRVILLWGYPGEADSGVQMDTWEYGGDDWLNREVSGPPGRVAPGMAYDANRQRVVLYGGVGSTFFFSDTWEWDGSAWTEMHPATIPGHGGVAAYDPRRKKVVLIDFSSPPKAWEWDGTNWAQVSTHAAPDVRDHCLAFDVGRNLLVHFGNYYNSDTWFLGQEWSKATSTTSPPARGWPGMVFDIARNRMVVFGGHIMGEIGLNDTWEYQGVERNDLDAAGDVADAPADRELDAASITDVSVADARVGPRDASSDHHFVPSPDPASCGCRIGGATQPSSWWLLLALTLRSRSKRRR